MSMWGHLRDDLQMMLDGAQFALTTIGGMLWGKRSGNTVEWRGYKWRVAPRSGEAGHE